jgi:hypothetical protein
MATPQPERSETAQTPAGEADQADVPGSAEETPGSGSETPSGAPETPGSSREAATAATLVYHAISLWIPALWGTIAFLILRRSRKEPLELRPTRAERRRIKASRQNALEAN